MKYNINNAYNNLYGLIDSIQGLRCYYDMKNWDFYRTYINKLKSQLLSCLHNDVFTTLNIQGKTEINDLLEKNDISKLLSILDNVNNGFDINNHKLSKIKQYVKSIDENDLYSIQSKIRKINAVNKVIYA